MSLNDREDAGAQGHRNVDDLQSQWGMILMSCVAGPLHMHFALQSGLRMRDHTWHRNRLSGMRSVSCISTVWRTCMTTPGVDPGLSRPQRDVLTTRRCGLESRVSMPVN